MSTPVLHVEHITMQFGGVVAVNDLSMDIYPGEIVALIGPNGAGKTTAFNCITGVYEPTNGRVDFMGEPIVCNHPRGKMKKSYAGAESERYLSLPTVSYTPDKITKRGIARTFQNIRLFKSMTVFENVLTAMHVRRTSNVFSATFRANHKEEAAQREKALELLKIVSLDDVKDELATALPYGKQRRLEIARALSTEPKLLFLDEPAAGMNPQESVELMDFIAAIEAKPFCATGNISPRITTVSRMIATPKLPTSPFRVRSSHRIGFSKNQNQPQLIARPKLVMPPSS